MWPSRLLAGSARALVARMLVNDGELQRHTCVLCGTWSVDCVLSALWRNNVNPTLTADRLKSPSTLFKDLKRPRDGPCPALLIEAGTRVVKCVTSI